MSEMTERVARALCRLQCERNRRHEWIDEAAMQRAIDCSWQSWTGTARAAIEAMGVPTDDMIAAAGQALARPRQHVGHVASDSIRGVTLAYRAMIEAALTEPGTPNAR
jgi:hypothetical protein